jgi:hypothetical protein
MAKLWALCMCFALGACAGNGDGLDENGRPVEEGSGALQPTFQSIQENVFTPVCTACHAGAGAPLGLRLDEGSSYALLVNAPSVEVPALQRVQPGDPDASYLIQKLEGTATVGSRMPLNGPPLPEATIAVIRQWITDGASSSSASGMSIKTGFAAAQIAPVSPISGEVLPGSTREVVVTSSVELDTSLLQAGLITLSGSGGDGEFGAGNERVVPAEVKVRSQQPTVLAITPLARTLPPDTYELRISGTDPVALADLDARTIDGDGDGVPGGDFLLHFTVEMTR